VIVLRYENSTLKNSRPCAHCIERLKMYNIKKITYSTGCKKIPYKTELVKNITSEWKSVLDKSVDCNKFKLSKTCYHSNKY
jgi:hypothetical protein